MSIKLLLLYLVFSINILFANTHNNIKVSYDPDYAPYSYDINGKAYGLFIDIFKEWGEKNNKNIEFIDGKTWDNALELVKNGKVDFFLGTDPYEDWMKSSKPYYKIKTSLFSLKNKKEDIKTIGIIGQDYEEEIRGAFKNVSTLSFDTYNELFDALINHKVDAIYDDSIAINDFILKQNKSHLIIKLDSFSSTSDVSAISNKQSLIKLFDDGFDKIDYKKLKELENNWIFNQKQKYYIKKDKSNLSLNLTKEEKEWLQSHPTINVGGELDYAPFDFVDQNKQYNGLSKDYLDYISSVTKLNFKIDTGKSWNELLSSLKDGTFDMLPAIYRSKEREKFVNFTSPYLTITDYYITKENYPKINSIESLYGKRVVTVTGYEVTSWLKQNYPKMKLIVVDNKLDALRAVESGEAEAFINDNPSATYAIEKNFILNLKLNNVVKERRPINLYMGVKKGYEPLVGIINKALLSISNEQKRLISSKWMSKVDSGINKLKLTKKELIWLSTKPTIKFAVDPNWLPIEAINENNQYEGMMADYLEKIKELCGIKFELVKTDKWTQSVDLVKNNKADMLAAASITPKREKFLNFSDTTITLTDGVIMKSDSTFITTLDDLDGLKVGVPENTSLHNMLKKEYPKLILVPISGTKNGVEQLSKGNIDAYVGNLDVISYIIFKKSLFDIKVVLKLEKKRALHIGVSKQYPIEAINIINKAINAITDDEKNTIRQKWVGLKINNNFDYSLLWKIGIGIVLLFALIGYNNHKLKVMVEKKTKDIQKQKNELELMISTFDKNVIFSKTDLKGNITHVSDAFCKISGYSYDELIGQPHNIVRHPDMKSEVFKEIWNTLKSEACIKVEVKNRRKDGSSYWVESKFEVEYDSEGNKIGYSAVRVDITNKKKVENLSANLEVTVEKRTKELSDQRKFIDSVMNSQSSIVITTEGKAIRTVNKAFLEFFNVSSTNEFKEKFGNCICNTFDTDSSEDYIKKKMNALSWIEYIKQHKNKSHKTIITRDGIKYIFSVTIDSFVFNDSELITTVFNDITELEKTREDIEAIHKQTRESIEYAALIQSSLVPDHDLFRKYFQEYFVIWHPKDIVGGDIYLFDELRNDDECMLMVIDCTGHGVPGAFVTMLVKAIERQIVAIIASDDYVEVSPAWCLSYFNRIMKKLLQQENDESVSNVGFDGQILYYNKKEKIIKCASAINDIFYLQNDEVKKIKADRQSVGYKDSDADFQFKEYTIDVSMPTTLYLSSDGYWDQMGGKKERSFGKKRLQALIEEVKDESMAEQQEEFLYTLHEYQGDLDRQDDVTFIGLKI